MTKQTDTDLVGTLEFPSEPGSSRSKWVAAILAMALIGWMGSGYVIPAEAPPSDSVEKDEAPAAVAVSVRESRAQRVEEVFTAEGQAQPDRRTIIRAEASADVESIEVSKGDDLGAGQVIAHLRSRDLEAGLEQARQEFERAKRELTNAETLFERGVATEDKVSNARATFATAEAQLTQAEEALDNAQIRAPFTGRLNALEIDVGEFIQAGTEIGKILDNDPLTVGIQVPQQAVGSISKGSPASVTFITGDQRPGTVVFVGSDASSETRTFTAEIEVANPDLDLASGLSAQVRIPTGMLEAHFVSPAILSLGSEGELGVKTVTEEDQARFHPVEIERAEVDGVWISGLPERARIITVGQGFVRDGETVDPSLEEADTNEDRQ